MRDMFSWRPTLLADVASWRQPQGASFQPPSFEPIAAPVVPRPLSSEETLFGDNRLLADIPFLTIGLIFGLMVIFALQRSLTIDIGRDGSLDVRSLIAQGASGYDLVVGRNEWWRIGLAPLLHGSQGHLIGNCVALFIVGVEAGQFYRSRLVCVDLCCQRAGRRGRFAPRQWPRHGRRRRIRRHYRAHRRAVRCELRTRG